MRNRHGPACRLARCCHGGASLSKINDPVGFRIYQSSGIELASLEFRRFLVRVRISCCRADFDLKTAAEDHVSGCAASIGRTLTSAREHRARRLSTATNPVCPIP
jgi:hypothetical protein